MALYPTLKAGEWVQPVRRGYGLACCDCGLIHKMNFRIVTTKRGRFIQFQAFRDNRATAAHRKRKKPVEDK
jgi:hypothetical protein